MSEGECVSAKASGCDCGGTCENVAQQMSLDKRKGRKGVSSGLTHECGVFGCIGTGEWPTSLEISQIICWGLVALQHR